MGKASFSAAHGGPRATTTRDACGARHFDPETKGLDIELRLNDPMAILEICSSLVAYDESTGEVRLHIIPLGNIFLRYLTIGPLPSSTSMTCTIKGNLMQRSRPIVYRIHCWKILYTDPSSTSNSLNVLLTILAGVCSTKLDFACQMLVSGR